MPLPDYRLVEDYQNSSLAREAAERKKAAQALAKKAWAKKHGADYARRKASTLVVTQLSGPPTPSSFWKNTNTTPLGNVKLSDQFISTKTGAVGPNRKFVGNKAVGKVAGEISTVAKNIYSPVYTGTAGVSQTYTGVNVTNPSTGVTKFTPSSEIGKSKYDFGATNPEKSIARQDLPDGGKGMKSGSKAVVKKAKGKAIVKFAAKGATRLIPGIGTALLIKDVYDVNKWAMSQPKKKKKGTNIYGTVSSNKIYKGY